MNDIRDELASDKSKIDFPAEFINGWDECLKHLASRELEDTKMIHYNNQVFVQLESYIALQVGLDVARAKLAAKDEIIEELMAFVKSKCFCGPSLCAYDDDIANCPACQALLPDATQKLEAQGEK